MQLRPAPCLQRAPSGTSPRLTVAMSEEVAIDGAGAPEESKTDDKKEQVAAAEEDEREEDAAKKGQEKKEAAVGALACQCTPGSGESIKLRASCGACSFYEQRPQGFELPTQRQTHSDLAARAMCCGGEI